MSSSNGVVPPVSHTQITYNNYYNNGTAEGQPGAVAPAAPAAPAAAPAAAVAGAPAPAPAAVPETAPAAPAPPPNNAEPNQQQNNPNPLGFIVTDAELQKVSEELYSKDTNNAMKYITIKVQGQKTDDSTTDDAPEK